MAGKKASELFISMLFDNNGLEKSGAGAKNVINNVAKFAVKSLAVFGSFKFLTGVTSELSELANHLSQVSKSTGENVETMQAWGRAITKNGGDADTFIGKVSEINKSIRTAFAENAPNQMTQTFNQLGISLKNANGQLKPTTQLFTELSGVISNSGQAKKDLIQSRLGLDDATIQLLSKGKTGVNQLVGEMAAFGVVNQKQIELSKEYKNRMDDFGFALQNVKFSIAEKVMPIFTKFLELTTKAVTYLKDHQPVVIGFFSALATIITAKFVPALLKAGVAMLTSPVFWMVAGVVALGVAIGLLIDDYQVWKEGGESAINWNSNLIKVLKVVGVMIAGVTTALALYKSVSVAATASMWALSTALKAGQAVMSMMKIATLALNAAFIATPIGWIVLGIGLLIGAGYLLVQNWGSVKKFFSGLFDWMAEKFKWVGKLAKMLGLGGKTEIDINKTVSTPSAEQSKLMNNASNTAISNSYNMPQSKNVTNNVSPTISNININVPNGDPNTIANGINNSFSDSLRNSTYGMNSGLRYP